MKKRKIPEIGRAEYELRKIIDGSGIPKAIASEAGMDLSKVEISPFDSDWDNISFVVCGYPQQELPLFGGTSLHTKCHFCQVDIIYRPNAPDKPKICMPCAVSKSKEES